MSERPPEPAPAPVEHAFGGAFGNPFGARIVAQYFPQLHPIPENDAWWGEGFTDWVNVKKARPLFPGHYQPRVPLGGRYYDQSQLDVLRWQAETALAHGVHAFCHYHYWFDGKQLLQTPTDLMLGAPDIRLRFCLAWANETWSRRWDGKDHHVLQLQTHPPDPARWELHFRYLIRAWGDERALRIDGRPVFLIYRAHKILELPRLVDYWRERARAAGLPGVYLVAMNQHGHPDPGVLRHFDAEMLFQPFDRQAAMAAAGPAWRRAAWRALPHLRARLPATADDALQRAIDARSAPRQVDYDAVWQAIVARRDEGPIATLRGAFVDWDNTARYGRRATLFRGASPERFEFWMRRLLGGLTEKPVEERLIFINAWNEWAEGAYLEPDERHGYGYLQALRRALQAEPARR